MRLTRLEIFGFKSFVDRFVLNFDEPMIGIVGPNGCGKSNIVDSLRWVLGETHAKQLRGGVLEDLIFSGSETKRPLGLAEVSITIQPREGWGELLSPYSTNPAALDAPVDVALEEGEISADGAEFKSVSEILADAEDGGAPIELVEGTADGNGLDSEPLPNVLRDIPGLLNCAEIQFTRRLYRSGESEYFINKIPCRLREMLELYRLMGLGARGLSIVQQGQISEIISKKPIERRELLEDAAGISGFRARLETAERKLEKTVDNTKKIELLIVEIEKNVKFLERQAKRARDRQKLKDQIREHELDHYLFSASQMKSDAERDLAKQTEILEKLEACKAALSSVDATRTEIEAAISTIDHDLIAKRRDRDEVAMRLTSERDRLNEVKLRRAILGEKLEGLERTIRDSSTKREELQKTRDQIAERETGLTEKLRVETELHQEAEQKLKAHEDQKIAAQSELATSQQTFLFGQSPMIGKLEEELQQLPILREKISTTRSALEAKTVEHTKAQAERSKQELSLVRAESELESIARHFSSVAADIAERVGKGADNSESINALMKEARVLASVLDIPADFERAVVAALGERINFLAATDPWKIAEQYAELHRNEGEVASSFGFLGSAAFVSSIKLDDFPQLRSVASSVGNLSEQVKARDLGDGALGALSDWLVVDDFSEALRLRQELDKLPTLVHFNIVTKSGEVVHHWGWQVATGRGQAAVDKALATSKRIPELEQHVIAQKAELEVTDRKLLEVANELTTLQLKYDAAQQELTELTRKQDELVRLRKEEQREADERRKQSLLEQQRRQEELLVVERDMQRELRRLGDNLASLRSELNQIERRRIELGYQEEQLNDRDQQLSIEAERVRAEMADLDSAFNSGVDATSQLIADLEGTIASSADAIRLLEKSREPLQLQMGQLSQTVHEQEREAKRHENELHAIDLRIQRIDLELENLQQHLMTNNPDVNLEELNVRVSEVSLEEAPEAAERSKEQAQRLRQRIEREGDVDPSSIEQFEQESARLTSLQAQREDLSSATKTLERTIKQLKDVSKDRLIHTFNAVSQKFEELVPRLFGGGAGQLRLINPDDPLTSGVEILVRPPGKRIASLELLSGGEKGLVAVSLLVALFLHKPSPVCVLDEVDAPFDEANLQRFLDLIDEISTTTQFLVVTHNRITMERVGRLVGITMQEKGVSKAFTLDLTSPEIDQFTPASA